MMAFFGSQQPLFQQRLRLPLKNVQRLSAMTAPVNDYLAVCQATIEMSCFSHNRNVLSSGFFPQHATLSGGMDGRAVSH
jgi:hypothetical protein